MRESKHALKHAHTHTQSEYLLTLDAAKQIIELRIVASSELKCARNLSTTI